MSEKRARPAALTRRGTPAGDIDLHLEGAADEDHLADLALEGVRVSPAIDRLRR